MIKAVTLLTFALLLAGCSSTYQHSALQTPTAKLDPTKSVLVAVPENGWYGDKVYRNSGRMTANAVRSAFSKYTSRVSIAADCVGDDCLKQLDANQFGYFVKPIILHWEDRATEWSGISDTIEIQLIVIDARTKQEIANASYTGKSKWASFGGDHPQDLLPEPTNAFVSRLYK
ncbi:DUF4823 domain-containing protein [Shewanella insulae]|uniref:DUF4823 domain-containing protein n=1 Tax=Shewanella insulae TaxID=2681496 RepID=A0A6L7I1M0_9GAMM|nr:DUF4823 domain-containing protein [Shewanella insulae]MCG9713906.1 DUF4823 domain-containing protein [Shewanella insulae]MXR70140.1 DUF4823 domain-containing protein [Shewanella insulae]